MNPLKLVLGIAGIFLTKKLRTNLAAFAPYLEIVSLNILLVVMTAILWTVGILFLLLGLFFHLADVSRFLAPALCTGVACLLMALTVTATGLALLKRMR